MSCGGGRDGSPNANAQRIRQVCRDNGTRIADARRVFHTLIRDVKAVTPRGDDQPAADYQQQVEAAARSHLDAALHDPVALPTTFTRTREDVFIVGVAAQLRADGHHAAAVEVERGGLPVYPAVRAHLRMIDSSAQFFTSGDYASAYIHEPLSTDVEAEVSARLHPLGDDWYRVGSADAPIGAWRVRVRDGQVTDVRADDASRRHIDDGRDDPDQLAAENLWDDMEPRDFVPEAVDYYYDDPFTSVDVLPGPSGAPGRLRAARTYTAVRPWTR